MCFKERVQKGLFREVVRKERKRKRIEATVGENPPGEKVDGRRRRRRRRRSTEKGRGGVERGDG